MRHVNDKEYLEIIEEIARKYRKLEELKANPKKFNRQALSVLKDIRMLIDSFVLTKENNLSSKEAQDV